MRKILPLLMTATVVLPMVASAQKNKGHEIHSGQKVHSVSSSGSHDAQVKSQLSGALQMAQKGQYENAANILFSLARRTELAHEKPQIKYLLGTMLIELKMYQTAAFQFVDVIRMNHPKYSKLAIEKLSTVADLLGDDTILNYAITKVDVNDIPEGSKDMINFRLGEIKMRNREYAKAQEHLGKINPSSNYYFQALYSKALSELEANQPDIAIETLRRMIEARARAPITDANRVEAQLALARALYQKKDWEGSIEAYSQVPRDTVMWHDAIFEQSWAMLRAARFRSVLSNFQSLHSAYYEEFYMPESLLLRAIVFLYICKYDEMEKVLSLFASTYGPMRTQIKDYLANTKDPGNAFIEVSQAYKQIKGIDKNTSVHLPIIVLKNILDQGEVKRSFKYLDKLAQEKGRIESNAAFRATGLGQYALKIISSRSNNTKIAIGEVVRSHLQQIILELQDLYEQAGFIRYEMINGRKEAIKKKISGKDIVQNQIDDKVNRQFYIQNGYEYYPFQGEYWLDEIGNYHYLGKQSCE